MSEEPKIIQNNQSDKKWLWVGLLVGLVLFVGGFSMGNRYQVVWNDSWPFIPEVVSVAESGSVLGDPLYAQVQQLMKTKYLRSGELNEEDMLFGAISGMVASAGDPYTAFFDPEDNQASEEQLSGRFSGVGMELGFNSDGVIAVVAPISGTPAAESGIMAGDVLMGVDETSIRGKSLQEVVSMIRGEVNTDVKLTVQRGTESTPREFTITRQEITIRTVEYEVKDGVPYVQLSRFGEATPREWDDAVARILASGSKSMILDMRNNPGGYLDGAIYVASDFFKDGNVVGQQDVTGAIQQLPLAGHHRLTEIEVVVLVNGGSASAAEIVAGALQSRDRAVVVGQTSFGKGSVQQVIDLAKNTSLHVTIARWVLPDGSNIDEKGIEPDVEVEMTAADFEKDRDPQLAAAMAELK